MAVRIESKLSINANTNAMHIETAVHIIIFRGFDKFLSANERNIYDSDYTGMAGYINYTQLHPD
jgi:tRNA splicing ligase